MGRAGPLGPPSLLQVYESTLLKQQHSRKEEATLKARREEMSSSPRPVPRRESPWGLPEGDTRQPQPHRCNDRAEDVIQACFEGNPFKTVPGPFKLFWRCMRSKLGEEPTEPYTYLDIDPPKREEPALDG